MNHFGDIHTLLRRVMGLAVVYGLLVVTATPQEP